MAVIDVGDLRGGAKVEVEGQPYTVVSNEFTKPGKGQSFNRVRLKHLITDVLSNVHSNLANASTKLMLSNKLCACSLKKMMARPSWTKKRSNK